MTKSSPAVLGQGIAQIDIADRHARLRPVWLSAAPSFAGGARHSPCPSGQAIGGAAALISAFALSHSARKRLPAAPQHGALAPSTTATAPVQQRGDGYHHHPGRHRDLLQGLGSPRRAADRLPPRLAAQRRRLGHPDAVLPRSTATGSSPTTAAATAARPRPRPATRWTPTPPTSPRSPTALDLKDAIHIGHSTGGGEVARYVARAKPGRVAKAVLIGAVPPVMVKIGQEPRRHAHRGVRRPARGAGRQPRAALHRSPDGPFYGFNRPGAKIVAGRHPATGGARA